MPLSQPCSEIDEARFLCFENNIPPMEDDCITDLMKFSTNITSCQPVSVTINNVRTYLIQPNRWIIYAKTETLLTKYCNDEISQEPVFGTYLLTIDDDCEIRIKDLKLKKRQNRGKEISYPKFPNIQFPTIQANPTPGLQKPVNLNRVDLADIQFLNYLLQKSGKDRREVEVSYFCVLSAASVRGLEAARLVYTSQGPVRGYKTPGENIFIFYGIPYATAPTGSDRFKAPLPPPQWTETFEAVNMDIICLQLSYFPIGLEQQQEDCLVTNIYVPDTVETNMPVVVYVHGGGFQMLYGEFTTPKRLLREKNLVVVNFNYRLGPHGFLCLGTRDIPGNAGMKDQIALLRWVKNNIAKFNGNPHDVTVIGYSAGSAAIELLLLSPLARGLFNKVILESGSALAPFSVQMDPIENAWGYAKMLNYTGSSKVLDGNFTSLEEDAFPKEFVKMKKMMRTLWINFIMTGKPVANGSDFPLWPPVDVNGGPHMLLDTTMKLRGPLLQQRALFWDDIYGRYYRTPVPPSTPPLRK
ncbi:unnamed protein product, partial [Iphiclides podalirius]